MFRFAHPELLYLLILLPLLIVFYVIQIGKKKKAIAEFGNPELLKPLMPLLSFKRGVWKFVMWMFALFFVILDLLIASWVWDLTIYTNVMYLSNTRMYVVFYAVFVLAMLLMNLYATIKEYVDRHNSTNLIVNDKKED